MVFAIDPGNEQSAWCIMTDNYDLVDFGKQENHEVMNVLEKNINHTKIGILKTGYKILEQVDHVVIERMMNYSNNVGQSVFVTCEWIGRFSQVAEQHTQVDYIFRKDEKMYLCQTMKANDSAIRHALIDRFAKFDKVNGKGTKKNPDVFYGVRADCWSAIAIAVTFLDMQKENINKKEVSQS